MDPQHIVDPRVVVITDRTELDEQIEKVFKGVNEDIFRTRSGKDLIDTLNAPSPWLICSLIQKFGRKADDESGDTSDFIEQLKKALPAGFEAKGNIFVFVDECHRTQTGALHKAMREIPERTLRFHRNAAAEWIKPARSSTGPLHPHVQVR